MLWKPNLVVVTSVPPFLKLVFFLGSTALVVFCWRTVLTSGCFGNVCGRFPGFTSFNFSCIRMYFVYRHSTWVPFWKFITTNCDCLRQHFKNLGVIKSCELRSVLPPHPHAAHKHYMQFFACWWMFGETSKWAFLFVGSCNFSSTHHVFTYIDGHVI